MKGFIKLRKSNFRKIINLQNVELNHQTLHGMTNLILSADAPPAPFTRTGPAEAPSAAAAVPVVAGGACALYPPAAATDAAANIAAAATLTAVAAGQPGAGMLVALAHLHRLQQQRFTLRDKAHRLVLQF